MLPEGLTAEDERAIYAALSSLAPLPKTKWRALLAHARVVALGKGGLFSQPGRAADRFAVVLRGLVRHYYVDAHGRESVKAFRGRLELTAPLAEMILDRPSRTFIEALGETALLVFRTADFERAAEHDVSLQRLARRIVERDFVFKEQREYEFLQLSAEERYRRLCAERPDTVALIPQYQVASYIGITPVALSRIRARARRK